MFAFWIKDPKGAKHCQICKSLYSQVVINRYCWIMSTFTLPKHYTGTAGDEFLHFGVGKFEFLQFIYLATLQDPSMESQFSSDEFFSTKF